MSQPHEPHWSGAHCHECFIQQAMQESHPMDEEPDMIKLAEIQHELYLQYIAREFGPKPLPDYLPEHYKAKGRR